MLRPRSIAYDVIINNRHYRTCDCAHMLMHWAVYRCLPTQQPPPCGGRAPAWTPTPTSSAPRTVLSSSRLGCCAPPARRTASPSPWATPSHRRGYGDVDTVDAVLDMPAHQRRAVAVCARIQNVIISTQYASRMPIDRGAHHPRATMRVHGRGRSR